MSSMTTRATNATNLGNSTRSPFDKEDFIPGTSQIIATKTKKSLLDVRLEEIDELYVAADEAFSGTTLWLVSGLFLYLALVALVLVAMARRPVLERRRLIKKKKKEVKGIKVNKKRKKMKKREARPSRRKKPVKQRYWEEDEDRRRPPPRRRGRRRRDQETPTPTEATEAETTFWTWDICTLLY